MALSIHLAGVKFKNSIGNINPMQNRKGLVAEHIYGSTLSESSKNIVTAQPSMTVIGNPRVFDSYVEINSGTFGSDGFNTNIANSEQCTLIAVVAKIAEMSSFLCCLSQVEGKSGFKGFLNSSAHIELYNNNLAVSSAPVSIPESSDFFVCVATASAGARHTNRVFHDGVTLVKSGVGGEQIDNSPYLVGTTIEGSGGRSGKTKIAYTAIYDRILSENEILDVYSDIKRYFAGKLEII